MGLWSLSVEFPTEMRAFLCLMTVLWIADSLIIRVPTLGRFKLEDQAPYIFFEHSKGYSPSFINCALVFAPKVYGAIPLAIIYTPKNGTCQSYVDSEYRGNGTATYWMMNMR